MIARAKKKQKGRAGESGTALLFVSPLFYPRLYNEVKKAVMIVNEGRFFVFYKKR